MKDSDTDTVSNPESESGEGPEQVEELVTPKSTGPKTPVREPTDTVSSLDETKDDTVVRSKQTQTPKHMSWLWAALWFGRRVSRYSGGSGITGTRMGSARP